MLAYQRTDFVLHRCYWPPEPCATSVRPGGVSSRARVHCSGCGKSRQIVHVSACMWPQTYPTCVNLCKYSIGMPVSVERALVVRSLLFCDMLIQRFPLNCLSPFCSLLAVYQLTLLCLSHFVPCTGTGRNVPWCWGVAAAHPGPWAMVLDLSWRWQPHCLNTCCCILQPASVRSPASWTTAECWITVWLQL